MELTINNIGLVKNATVKLEGLSVIAGENDTGKSTVGKTVFSIIKGMNNHHKDFKEDKFTQIIITFYTTNILFNLFYKSSNILNSNPHILINLLSKRVGSFYYKINVCNALLINLYS